MEISILQWNIYYREDIRKIASFLKANKADIICLQELTVNASGQAIKDTPRYIADQLGYNYYCKELPIESTDGTAMMLANGVFSRYPITNKAFTWINQPVAGGGYDDEYRAYVEVMLEVRGRSITVGTTHMSYTHRFDSSPQKQEEADRLLAIIQKRPKSYIFTGDLNALPNSYTINGLSKYLEHVGPDMDQKTWTTKPFSYNGFDETELNWRLDYIFASSDVKVSSSKILATDYSDHLPVLANLKLGS